MVGKLYVYKSRASGTLNFKKFLHLTGQSKKNREVSSIQQYIKT